MTLWAWSLAAWRREGVEAAALARQDGAGESVALLLWRAWAGAAATGGEAAARALAMGTEAGVLAPLRAARRALKTPPEGLDGAEALHSQLRGVELAAERALLESLARLTPQAGGDPQAAFQRLSRSLGL